MVNFNNFLGHPSSKLHVGIHWKLSLALIFVCTHFAYHGDGQSVPIPDRPLGFQYGTHHHRQSLIHMDALLDLTCPDSKLAFPTLKQVADHYGVSNLRLNVIVFPPPYHRCAYLTTQSTFIINDMDADVTFTWMKDFFNVQEQFYNSRTVNKSNTELMSLIVDVAGQVVDRSTFLFKLENGNFDTESRVMWKYCCSRAQTGTPQFLINGVSVLTSSTWTLEDWKDVIDPLLGIEVTNNDVN